VTLDLQMCKICVPNSVTYLSLIGHLCLSGMWLHVAPRADIKSTCVLERDGLRAQNYCYFFRLNSQQKLRVGGDTS
jgi:hypothetical protein